MDDDFGHKKEAIFEKKKKKQNKTKKSWSAMARQICV